MVPLPLFKLGALFVRQMSKYGANAIKKQAHEHPRFRAIAAQYGQTIHQINMRMSVAALRDVAAEQRAAQKAAAPTVKTEEQTKAEEALKEKAEAKEKKEASKSVWSRKFRTIPEAKAVDLFADVVGDTFILLIATALILYEYVRSSGKPDKNAVKIEELEMRHQEEERRIGELEEAEKARKQQMSALEDALKALEASKGNPRSANSRLFNTA